MLLYNIGTKVYFILIRIASLFNPKAKLWINGRKNLLNKIGEALPKNEQRIWIHCASLGEFEQGRPVIERLKSLNPELKIVLTFFSPSGFEVRKNYKGADYIFYLPEDTKSNARKFISLINPEYVIFVKYEFWVHYINELKLRKIPLYLISANFRDGQLFFRWYGGFYRSILHEISHLFVQNRNSVELLNEIGIYNVTISGDTRFDRVVDIASQTKDIPLVSIFKQNKKIFIGGSTWRKDNELIVDLINSNSLNDTKFIIAPHEIHEQDIEELKNSIKIKSIRFSMADESNIMDAQVLIIDNIGMLSSLYRYASVAYIGGGFGKGIHNTLEAATFGMPVLFGPNYQKFREAIELVRLGAAFPVNSSNELKDIVSDLLNDESKLNHLSEIAKNYVNINKGATDIILDKINQLQTSFSN